MKIVRLSGGLGNQMFQFALYTSNPERGGQHSLPLPQLSDVAMAEPGATSEEDHASGEARLHARARCPDP